MAEPDPAITEHEALVKCQSCGHSNPDHFLFCIHCGSPAWRPCFSCGMPLSPQVRFCGGCGSPVFTTLEAMADAEYVGFWDRFGA